MNRISANEIRQIAEDYQIAFPSWKIIGMDTLVRFEESVAQVVWFDRLRTGGYRPSSGVCVLVAPGENGGTQVLPQLLGVKNREIAKQVHAKRLPAVVNALKTEVLPSMIKPINAEVVANLLSSRAAGRPVSAYALACLYAALGRERDAVKWIAEYNKAFRELALPSQASDRARAEFLGKVEEWIRRSSCSSEMRAVAECEEQKFINGR